MRNIDRAIFSKVFHIPILILFFLASTPAGAAVGGGLWVAGNFETYVFDHEQRDSQLIVSPSGKTLLIDAGEASWNTGNGAAFIANKLREVMGPGFTHIDYVMPSHLHLDHMGYAGYGGIWGLIETQGFTVGKLIDRDAGRWVDGNNDGVCDPKTEIVWHNAGTVSGTARNWLCYATNPAYAAKLNRVIPIVGSTSQIDLGPGVIVTIIGVDAQGVNMVDGVTTLQGDHTADATPPSENDYSIAIKVSFGQLDYATAGDTDGEYATSSFGYTYNDVERVIAPRFGRVEILRANHHGSGHSTSAYYVSTLNPDVSIISCGANSYGHPEQTTLDRLLATGAVYLTNTCDTTRNYGNSIIANGDVVIRSVNGTNYTVNGTPFVANGSTPPPAQYTVADIKINEVLPDPDTLYTTEWVELYNPTPQVIDLSGAKIDDIANGGGSPYTIPNGTLISARGYFVLNRTNYFNNTGDDVRLLTPAGVLVDRFSYTTSANDRSWARMPDGGPWSSTMDATPTKGTANQ